MSQFTPEVGDVFQSVVDTNLRIHIIDKHKSGYEILVSDKREVLDVNEWHYWKDDYIYLGHGKAKINKIHYFMEGWYKILSIEIMFEDKSQW